MADLETRIFIGTDEHDATAQLNAAIKDGSFPVLSLLHGQWLMWITHHMVIPGAMQMSSYELHVTAWVKVDPVAGEQVEAIANEQR
jgi:hypothetical protein